MVERAHDPTSVRSLSVGVGSCFSAKKGKKKRELNASSYENTMEAPVICMESEANQVHEARRAAVESE